MDVADFVAGACPAMAPQLSVFFGPRLSGKTKLFFQLAVNHAKAGRDVVFITPQASMEKVAEALTSGPTEVAALKRIQMKYIETDDDLNRSLLLLFLKVTNSNRYVVNADEISPCPQVIIIDGLSSYFLFEDGGEDHHGAMFRKGEREGMCALFHTMALIQDTYRRLKADKPLQLLIGFTTPSPMLYSHMTHLFARHKCVFFMLQLSPRCAEPPSHARCFELTKVVPFGTPFPPLHLHL